jgi:hypothetical protein
MRVSICAFIFALAGFASALAEPVGNNAERSSPAPDVTGMRPMIHRLGIDTHMQGPLSTVLKLTSDNKTWRCRQMFFEIKGEHLVKHWIAQGWNDGNDLMYARMDNGHYVAIHVLADGTFVTAVSIDDETGTGIRLNYEQVKDVLDDEVARWNDTGQKN